MHRLASHILRHIRAARTAVERCCCRSSDLSHRSVVLSSRPAQDNWRSIRLERASERASEIRSLDRIGFLFKGV